MGINYPASKSDVLDCAKKNGADDGLINDLEKLPDDEFSRPDQVEKALSDSRCPRCPPAATSP